MLLTKTIQINISSRNMAYYLKLGYNVHKNDIITIPTEQLPKMCKDKVDVQCDECKEKYTILYSSYTRNIEGWDGKYTCPHCTKEKISSTRDKNNLTKSLLSKTISMFINGSNFSKYKEKGYDVKMNTSIRIKIKDIPLSSPKIVKVKCDYCQTIKTTQYSLYVENISHGGKYACSKKCAVNKTKETNLKTIGVENQFQNEAVKEKMKITNIKNHGVEYPMQNLDIQAKASETNLANLGVKYPGQSEIVKEKTRETCRKKYDVEWTSQISKLYNKSINNSNTNKLFEDTDIIYQSMHEYHFLKYCKSKNILKYIEKNIQIKYSTNVTNLHYYYPDFNIPLLNLIVEIKSQYIFDLDVEKNLIKEQATLKNDFNFIFIIDKNYNEFDTYINIIYNLEKTKTENEINEIIKINKLSKHSIVNNFSYNKPILEIKTKR